MKKLVLDTNILVSALMTPKGKPAQVWNMITDELAQMYYSDLIMQEYVKVLYRRHLNLYVDIVGNTLEDIKRFGTNLVITPSTIPLPDEYDRVFYDTAATAGAYLITGNIKHFPQEPFILTPADFLTIP